MHAIKYFVDTLGGNAIQRKVLIVVLENFDKKVGDVISMIYEYLKRDKAELVYNDFINNT